MNTSGYVGHTACCLIVGLTLWLGLDFGVWLVCVHAHVFTLIAVVIVTFPLHYAKPAIVTARDNYNPKSHKYVCITTY